MIDTDKYEGHTEGKWNVLVSSGEDIAQAHLHDETAGYYFFSQGYNREQEENYNHNESRANAKLMTDAPLLLAEVKRLRELIERVAHSEIEHIQMHGLSVVETEHWDELLIAAELLERDEE